MHTDTMRPPPRSQSSSVAKTAYAVPWIRDLVAEITGFLRENVEWLNIPQSATGRRMLDYACGNGAASRVSQWVAEASKKALGYIQPGKRHRTNMA